MAFSDTWGCGEKSKVNSLVIIEEALGSSPGYASGPERALLSALLFDGVQAYMSYCLAETEEAKRKYYEAYLWVNCREDDYIFSFNGACEALGIEPDYLRLGLINICVSQQREWKRGRRME